MLFVDVFGRGGKRERGYVSTQGRMHVVMNGGRRHQWIGQRQCKNMQKSPTFMYCYHRNLVMLLHLLLTHQLSPTIFKEFHKVYLFLEISSSSLNKKHQAYC